MHPLTNSARRLGLAALLAATLVPAAAAAEVPTAADRADRVQVPSDDQLVGVPVAADADDRRPAPAVVPVQADAADRAPSPPVAADAPDRVPVAVPVAADAPDRVREPVPVAADAPDRRVPAPAAPADDGLPLAAPLGLVGLLAAAAVGAASCAARGVPGR